MSDWHDSKEWREARAIAKRILEPICAQCHKELHGNDWTIDHIIAPRGSTPDHSIGNLQSMCRSCNGRKQDKTLVRTNWKSKKWYA